MSNRISAHNKKGRGRPAFEPTDEHRKLVRDMVAAGIPHESIARVIGISRNTLEKHFREEIDTAAAEANAKVAMTLFEKALSGDTTAMIWWTKSRMGWSEKQKLEHSGEGRHIIMWGGED